MMSHLCANCGAELNTNDRVCANCGEPIVHVWPPVIAGQYDNDPPEKLLTASETTDRIVGATASVLLFVGLPVIAALLSNGLMSLPALLVGVAINISAAKKLKMQWPYVSKGLMVALQVQGGSVALALLGDFVWRLSGGFHLE